MYKDVKKKLLAVVLCICMVIGAVEIAPRVKAASSTQKTTSIAGKRMGEVCTFIVTYSIPNATYDGKEHKPVLQSVKVGENDVTAGFRINTSAEPVAAGAYDVTLECVETQKYEITGDPRLEGFTIGKATISSVAYTWDGKTIVLQSGSSGVKPRLSSDGKDAIKVQVGNDFLYLTEYDTTLMNAVGAKISFNITVSDEVKKNFKNPGELDGLKATCNVAYDLSNNDAYKVAFVGDSSEPLESGSANYTGGMLSPSLGIFDKSNNRLVWEVNTDAFDFAYQKDGAEVQTVADRGSYQVEITAKNGFAIVGSDSRTSYFAGTFTGTFQVIGKSKANIEVWVKNPNGGVNINLNSVGANLVLPWTGQSVMPTIESVMDGGKSIDYDGPVPGTNTTNVGNAQIIITPAAYLNYEGSLTLNYRISSDLRFGKIEFSGHGDKPDTLYYTGEPQIPTNVEVKDMSSEIPLWKGNDYVLTYNYQDSNGNWVLDEEHELTENDLTDILENAANRANMAKSGTKRITAWGRGIYAGKKTEPWTYTVSKVNFNDPTYQSWFTVTLGQNSFYYDGAIHEPAVTVTYNNNDGVNKILTDSDITVKYPEQTDSGKVTITITAKKNSGFEGTLTKDFTIRPLNLADAEVADASYEYTGEPIAPRFVIKNESYGADFEYHLKPVDDYKIVDAESLPSLPSTHTIYIQANDENKNILNNAGDPIPYTYTIERKDISDLGFTLQGAVVGADGTLEVEWWGKSTEPELGGTTLECLKDYSKPIYSNSTTVTPVGGSLASVEITGAGNYKGTVTLEYRITPRSFEKNANLIEIIPTVTGGVGGFAVSLSVTDQGEGVETPKLVSGIDYDVESVRYLTSNDYDPGPTLQNWTKAGEYEITIQGKGNYTGQKTVKVKCGIDISDAILSLPRTSFTYNATEQKPASIWLTVNGTDEKFTDDGNYTITYSRKDGTDTDHTTINAGTIYVTAKGKSEKGYFGTTSFMLTEDGKKTEAIYKIAPLEINDKYRISIVDTARNPVDYNGYASFTYTGKSINPKIEVELKSPEGNLDAKLDPTFDMEDVVYGVPGDTCVNVGTHAITVKGKGNFSGYIEGIFWIDRMPISDARVQKNWDATVDIPELTLTLSTKPIGENKLVENVDYSISAPRWERVTGSDWDNVCVYTVTGLGNFSGTKDFSLEITSQIVLKAAADNENPQAGETFISVQLGELMVDPTNGLRQITPEYSLYYRSSDGKNIPLTLGEDYVEVAWGTNKMPGTADNYLTIKGKGRYAPSPVTFDLTLYTDISKAEFVEGQGDSGEGGSTLYDGASVNIEYLLEMSASDKLSELVLFEEMWPGDGMIAPSNYTVKLPDASQLQIGKTITITIEGTKQENRYYAGTKKISVKLTGELKKDQIRILVDDDNAVEWKGIPITPGGIVKVFNGNTLMKGGYLEDGSAIPADWDYTVIFENSDKIGLGTAHIYGVNKYSGSLSQDFRITCSFSNLDVEMKNSVDGGWNKYDGGSPEYVFNLDTTKNQPTVRLVYNKDGVKYEIDSRLYSIEGDDVETVGDKRIVISESSEEKYQKILIGDSRVVHYTLTPIPAESVKVEMSNPQVTYTGYEMNETDIGLSVKCGTYTLTDADYTLEFRNAINTNAMNVNGVSPSVYIQLQGKFSGSIEKPFTILPLPIGSERDINAVVDEESLIYTGKEITPQFTLNQVTGKIGTLRLNKDYEIVGYWDSTKQTFTDPDKPYKEVGSYYIQVRGLGNYASAVNPDRYIPYTITQRGMNAVQVEFINTEDCPVHEGKPVCVYDGEEHRPQIQVVYNGITLNGPDTRNPDYSVNYTDNIKAGTATITITGNGSFSDKKEVYFTIEKKSILGDDMVYLDADGKTFADEQEFEWKKDVAVRPTVSVTDLSRGEALVQSDSETGDYKVTYEDDNMDEDAPQTNAGKVTMTITGTGNYTGTKEFTYYIGEDISKLYAMVDGQRKVSTTYNGLAQAPAENRIGVGGVTADLVEPDGTKRYDIAFYKGGFDNKVTSDQMINADTYYVSVIGVPSKGTYAKSSESNSCIYTIQPRSIAQSYILVSGYDSSYYYTGQPIHPNGIVVEDTDLPVSNNAGDPQRRSVKLIANTDYVIDYNSGNCTYAGKASFAVNGTGNYTGTRVAYFNIISSNMSGNNTSDGTSEGTGSLTNGSTTIAASDIILGFDNSTYECMMYNGYPRTPNVTINGVSTNDFIVTASNNIRPGVATLTIQGTGNNFTGTITKNYTIKADLSVYGSIAAIEDQVYSGYQITPNVTVICGGNLLSQGSNYTLTYQNNINVGTATVTATATNDSYYIGSVTGRFNISNTAGGMEITGYSSYYTYTGYAITPNVIVTMNGRMLTNGSDYTVTYSNNINVGTATMTVTGIGSYSGTKTINYTIEAKNIENCLTTAVDNYQYTGNTYTPNVTITDSTTGKTLAAGTDYTITYSNNKNPGTATITVTALSKNYTGSKVISFQIASAAVSGLRTSTIKNNSIKLAWSAQDYADGYQICNSSNRVVATTTKNRYTVKGLTSCTTYKFKVRSYVENADGSISYGSFSTAVSAKTLLNTPTLKAKSTKKGKVTLTWTKVSKATGYEIYYSTKKDGIYTRLKTISKSSTRKYVDSGLASGEKYYYTIRAYRTTNGVKTYSNYNTIKSVKVK